MFLSNTAVENGIRDAAARIYVSAGFDPLKALDLASYFIFGSEKIASSEYGSISRSLWGLASREFAESVSGNITLIASAETIKHDGVFSVVELHTILSNSNVTSFGTISIENLS